MKLTPNTNPQLDAFMVDYKAGTTSNPFSGRERVWDNQAAIELSVFNGRIHLSGIRSFEKGKKSGSGALDFLCGLADKHGVEIDCDAVPFGGKDMSEAQLTAWYKSRGFARAQDYEELVRQPKGAKVAAMKCAACESGDCFSHEKTAALSPNIPREVVNEYSYGLCTRLAIAMHDILGWPIEILWTDEEEPVIDHAFVRMPNGKGLDIAGVDGQLDFARTGQEAIPIRREDLVTLIGGEVPGEIERAREVVKKYVIPNYLPGMKTADGPSQDQNYDDSITQTPAFKAWFGASKVVDDHGRPLRVYHGTRESFESFDKDKATPTALYGPGLYFTASPEVASGNGKYTDPQDIANAAAWNQAGYAWQGSQWELHELTKQQMNYAKRLMNTNSYVNDAWNDIGTRQNRNRGLEALAEGEPAFRKWLANEGPKDIRMKLFKETEKDPKLMATRPQTVAVFLKIVNPFYAESDMDKETAVKIFGEGKYITQIFGTLTERRGSDVYEAGAYDLGSKVKANEAIQRAGYDGIQHTGGRILGTVEHPVWVAFEPNQVKSAIGNSGNFDPSDHRMTASEETNLTFNEREITAEEMNREGSQHPGVRIEALQDYIKVGAIEVYFSGDNAYMSGVTVEKRYQGLGIGQKLYDKAIAYAKKRGCHNFYSDNNSAMSRDAHKAWERLKKRYPVEFEEDENGYDSNGRKKIPLKTASVVADGLIDWTKPVEGLTMSLNDLNKVDRAAVDMIIEDLPLVRGDSKNPPMDLQIPIRWMWAEAGFHEQNHDGPGVDRKVSEIMELMKKGKKFGPALYHRGHWLDGNHRIKAARALGINEVPTINLADFTPGKREKERAINDELLRELEDFDKTAAHAWTQEEMIREADGHRSACFMKGDPGYAKPQELLWKHEEKFDLNKIDKFSEGWYDDLAQELQERVDEGESSQRYVDALIQAVKNGTTDVIVVAEGTDGSFYVWDGNHRVGLAHVAGVTHLPAIVGYREVGKTAAELQWDKSREKEWLKANLSDAKKGPPGIGIEYDSVGTPGGSAFWVTRNADGKPIAFICFDAKSIFHIGVLPKYRGQGIASELIKAVESKHGHIPMSGPYTESGEALANKHNGKMSSIKLASPEDLDHLKSYLTMTEAEQGEEVARNQIYHFKEWIEENHEELSSLFPEDEDDYLDDYSGFGPEVLAEYLEDGGSYYMQNDPADAPSFLHMEFVRDVQDEWLVHFTDDADGVAYSGFTLGVDDVSKLGLTTYFKNDGHSKKHGGYNFAYAMEDFKRYHTGDKYGSECVVFRASGIEVYHYGDSEPQVIFWGKDAVDLVPVVDYDGMWAVKNPDDNEIMVSEDELGEVVNWIVDHHQLYFNKEERKKVSTLIGQLEEAREELWECEQATPQAGSAWVKYDETGKAVAQSSYEKDGYVLKEFTAEEDKADTENTIAELKKFIAEAEATLQQHGISKTASAESITESPAFKRWFGNSKVVDKQGKPQKMFHGTFNNFDVFDTNEGTVEGASFFTPLPEVANSFADYDELGIGQEEGQANVLAVYLSIKNPKVIHSSEIMHPKGGHSFDIMRAAVQAAREGGFDGLHLLNVEEGGGTADQWAAFFPNQIKSAIGNNGKFNPKNHRITAAHRVGDLFATAWTETLPLIREKFLFHNDREKSRVQELMKALEAGEELPPILVLDKGGKYLVMDGNHRLQAAINLKRPEIEAYVVEWKDLKKVLDAYFEGDFPHETHELDDYILLGDDSFESYSKRASTTQKFEDYNVRKDETSKTLFIDCEESEAGISDEMLATIARKMKAEDYQLMFRSPMDDGSETNYQKRKLGSDKTAYIAPKEGIVALAVDLGPHPVATLTIDLGIPNFTIFSIKIPIDGVSMDEVKFFIEQAFEAMLDEVSAFMLTMQYPEPLVVSVYKLALDCFEKMTIEDASDYGADADDNIRFYEASFDIPEGFAEATLDKVVTASTEETYEPEERCNGMIPEIKFLPLSAIHRQEMDFRPEVTSVSDEVAASMDYSEPVDVTAFRYGRNHDDTEPVVTLSDGHHRYAAAIQTGKPWLPVSVKAINAKGAKINALIALSREIERGNSVTATATQYSSGVISKAKQMLEAVKPEIAGDVFEMEGNLIETHTLGCRNQADEAEETWWDGLWEFYDKYTNDGISLVLGDPTDGKFVTITPQRKVASATQRLPPTRHWNMTTVKPTPDNPARTIQMYKNRSLKALPRPYFLMLYDRRGAPVGVAKVPKNWEERLTKAL